MRNETRNLILEGLKKETLNMQKAFFFVNYCFRGRTEEGLANKTGLLQHQYVRPESSPHRQENKRPLTQGGKNLPARMSLERRPTNTNTRN